MEKKRYWLKLDKDFLKSPQIKVIKNMPNGKDYIIFYLTLMLESVETVGHLRFSELVPYNEEMLASVTDTNIDITRSALALFSQLGLVEKLDDGTIYLTQVAQMTGKESESAERVRQYRLKNKEQNKDLLQCNEDVTECNTTVTECNENVPKCNDNKEKQRIINREERTENNKQRIINKEDNTENNKQSIKKKYGTFKRVELSDEDFERLTSEYPNYEKLIEYLDFYIAEKGYKSKSHYLAIKRWVVDAVNGKSLANKQKNTFEDAFDKALNDTNRS